MLLVRVTAATVIALGCSVPALAAKLVHNGSFERPSVATGQLQQFSTGDKFTGGWTVVGAPGNVDIVPSSFVFQGQSFPAKRGDQWLDLTGSSNTATGVQQIVNTTRGATYEISLYVGSAYDTVGALGTSSTVHVLVDGSQIATVKTKGEVGTAQRWRKFSIQFVAHKGNTAVAFINGDPPSDTDCGIDGVSVTHVAVP